MNCIVIDDDKKDVCQIRAFIDQTDALDIIDTFACPKNACSLVSGGDIELIFIEIELLCMSGFDFLKSLSNPPHVIIVSKNPKHALDAFFYNVTDYLIKPVDDYSRFLKAIMKVNHNLMANTKENNHFYIKVDTLLVKLDYNEIYWLEAFGDFVKIVTLEKTYITKSTMKLIEKKLPIENFIKVHRSYIVNLNKIKNIDQHNLQIEKKIIPISFRLQKNLRQKITLA